MVDLVNEQLLLCLWISWKCYLFKYIATLYYNLIILFCLNF